MAKTGKKKKKKSGRSEPEQRTESKPAKTPRPPSAEEHHSKREERSLAENDGEKLHSPWLPLIWIMVPLLVCVVYGIATR